MLNLISKYRHWFLLSLTFHFIALFFSVGFLHPDEHFQILEFLNFKLGLTPEKELPWEFREHMRPWVQPFFYYFIVKILSFFGATSPFHWAFCFRFISLALGFFSQIYMIFTLLKQGLIPKKWEKSFVMVFSSLWFLPFIHARISSEAIAASVFSITLSLLINQFSKKSIKRSKEVLPSHYFSFFLIGALLGLSFQLRYHLGLMIAPAILWPLFYKKINIPQFFTLLLGLMGTFILAIFIDFWGYGIYTFPPWNYLSQNLIEDKASQFGTTPWWSYFKDVSKKSFWPIGLAINFSFLFYWAKKPQHFFSWITFPFFLVHCLIGHKEWRFLFPLTPFIPYFLIQSCYSFEKSYLKFNFFSLLVKVVLIINFFLLYMASSKAVHPSYGLYRFIYDRPELNQLYYLSEYSPFHLFKLNIFFYKRKMSVIKHRTGDRGWIYINNFKHFNQLYTKNYCDLKYSNIPSLLLSNNKSFFKRSKIWSVFYCE